MPDPTQESYENNLSAEEWKNRGNAAAEAGNYQLAVDDYTAALVINPQDASVHDSRGTVHYWMGEFELMRGDTDAARTMYGRAIEDFGKALEIDPKYSKAYGGLGAVRKEMGELAATSGDTDDAHALFGQAIEDFGKALEVDPQDIAAYNNRGLVQMLVGYLAVAQGDTDAARTIYGQAIEDFGKALEIDPLLAIAYGSRGLTHCELGDLEKAWGDTDAARTIYGQAIEDFGKALEIDPQYAQAYRNRGLAHHTMGNLEMEQGGVDTAYAAQKRAIADYTVALEINPQYAIAYTDRGDAHSRIGELEEKQGGVDTAYAAQKRVIADYTAALEINPQYAPAYTKRAWVWRMLGKHEVAADDFRKAVEFAPFNLMYRAALARQLNLLDDYDAAMEQYTALYVYSSVKDQPSVLRKLMETIREADFDATETARYLKVVQALRDKYAALLEDLAFKALPEMPDEDDFYSLLAYEIEAQYDDNRAIAFGRIESPETLTHRYADIFSTMYPIITGGAGSMAVSLLSSASLPAGTGKLIQVLFDVLEEIVLRKAAKKVTDPVDAWNKDKSIQVVNALHGQEIGGAEGFADRLSDEIVQQYGHLIEGLHLSTLGVIALIAAMIERMFTYIGNDLEIVAQIINADIDPVDAFFEGLQKGKGDYPVQTRDFAFYSAADIIDGKHEPLPYPLEASPPPRPVTGSDLSH